VLSGQRSSKHLGETFSSKFPHLASSWSGHDSYTSISRLILSSYVSYTRTHEKGHLELVFSPHFPSLVAHRILAIFADHAGHFQHLELVWMIVYSTTEQLCIPCTSEGALSKCHAFLSITCYDVRFQVRAWLGPSYMLSNVRSETAKFWYLCMDNFSAVLSTFWSDLPFCTHFRSQ